MKNTISTILGTATGLITSVSCRNTFCPPARASVKRKASAWWKLFQPSNSNNSRTSHKSLDSRRSHTQAEKRNRQQEHVAMGEGRRERFFPVFARCAQHAAQGDTRYAFATIHILCYICSLLSFFVRPRDILS